MDPSYEITAEDGIFTFQFRAPKQLLLHPQFEQMVWDECLRHAHAAGHIPVGPVHIEVVNDDKPVEALEEGTPIPLFPVAALSPDIMLVSAQVQIAVSL